MLRMKSHLVKHYLSCFHALGMEHFCTTEHDHGLLTGLSAFNFMPKDRKLSVMLGMELHFLVGVSVCFHALELHYVYTTEQKTPTF